MSASTASIAQAYVELALAIGMHLPGYVDSYYGPAEWKERVTQRGLRPVDELMRDASILAADIDQNVDMDLQQKDYLTCQARAIQTRLRILQGEELTLTEEVEGLYDITPKWTDESEFREAHRVLDELLPGDGSLGERMVARRKTFQVSYAQAEGLIPTIVEHLRTLTRGYFPLPGDESFDVQTVSDKPWSWYNWYLGGGHSRMEINLDLPLYAIYLTVALAHEGYPGHHTEFAIKEMQLINEQGRYEHSINLTNSPSMVVSEAIATRALDAIMTDEEQIAWHAEEILPRVGLGHIDARREHMIEIASRDLYRAGDNVVLLLHERSAEVDTAIAYLQEYQLFSKEEASKSMEFIMHPLLRSYKFTYGTGYRMLRTLFEKKGDMRYWFTRLLTEPVTPGQIRSWIED